MLRLSKALQSSCRLRRAKQNVCNERIVRGLSLDLAGTRVLAGCMQASQLKAAWRSLTTTSGIGQHDVAHKGTCEYSRRPTFCLLRLVKADVDLLAKGPSHVKMYRDVQWLAGRGPWSLQHI